MSNVLELILKADLQDRIRQSCLKDAGQRGQKEFIKARVYDNFLAAANIELELLTLNLPSFHGGFLNSMIFFFDKKAHRIESPPTPPCLSVLHQRNNASWNKDVLSPLV